MSGKDTAAEDVAYETDVLPLIHAASAAWIATWRSALARDGRAMEGGWPGTQREARAWVDARVTPALTRLGRSFGSPEGAARAARDLYAVSRRAWLIEARPEPA